MEKEGQFSGSYLILGQVSQLPQVARSKEGEGITSAFSLTLGKGVMHLAFPCSCSCGPHPRASFAGLARQVQGLLSCFHDPGVRPSPTNALRREGREIHPLCLVPLHC